MNFQIMFRRLLSVLVVVCLTTGVHAQSIVINEFLASNGVTNVDEDGEASDWFELYNLGSEAVDLGGYTTTDNANQATQWTFPSVTLDPGGFLLVWASGKNRTSAQLHTNFKLSASGEYLGLYTPAGVLVDGLTFGAQLTDVSSARFPNGTGSFQSTTSPTPGARNQGGGIVGDPLTISPQSKLFTGSLTINLDTAVQGAEIRYTLDGSSVTTSSQLYGGPLSVSSTTALRARAFRDGVPVSADLSQFYVKDYPGHVPVLSLATDRSNLYGSTGIFDNPEMEGDNWERPVSANLLELDGSGFQINCGIRVHGGYSRRYPKKSVRLHFRSDYGQSSLNYKLFSQKALNVFNALVIHSGGSYDQYYENSKWTLLRDPLSHALWLEKGGAVSVFRPVILYINGELWGIYHIRERVNDDYVKDNFGGSDPDLLEWSDDSETPEIKDGDLVEWNKTYSFFKNNSLTTSAKYEEAKRQIDIDNFIDYQIIEIFAGNRDWPHNNQFFFRDRVAGAKWRWILWDAEITFHNPDIHLLEWATRDRVRTDIISNDNANQLYGTLFLRKLVENSDFQKLFINRFGDFLNTTLASGHVRSVFDELAASIQSDVPIEAGRWGVPASQWNDGVKQIRDFIAKRTAAQRDQIVSYFGLPGKAQLTVQINSPTAGAVRLNNLILTDLPWAGTYFRNIPVTLEALPNPGFRFAGWSGASQSSSPSISLNLSSTTVITANFESGSPPPPAISGFTPASGGVGTSVAISGSGFIGTTAVSFNGVAAAAYTVDSDNQIHATVPSGATTGRIRVTTPGGMGESSTEFTVTAGGGETVTFNPTDDAYVRSSSPTGTSASSSTLRVKKASSETLNSYLKFSVSGVSGAVQNAKLRLYVTDASSDGGAVYLVSNNNQGSSTAWTQGGLNWNNAPAISGTALSSVGAASLNSWVEFDVTAALTGNGTFSFGIQNNSSNVVYYSSREGSNKPQLVIQTGSGGTPAPTISSFSPTSGAVGTEVAISGANFVDVASVAFNATAAAYTVDSPSQIHATVPAGATTGKISVTTATGTAVSANEFTVTAGGGETTVTFQPVHDAYVKSSSATTSFGSAATLRARKSGSETLAAYLKFEVMGLSGAVQSAKLRLYVTDASSDGGAVYAVSNNYQGTTTAWVQSGLNWNNAPAISGTTLSSVGSVSVGAWVEFEVTAAITGNGTYSFGLMNNVSDVVYYSSKEGANKPELIIQTGSSSPASAASPDVTADAIALPEAFHLAQNYPNPFNPETRIEYDLPEAVQVRLTIYNVLGHEVAVLVDEERPAGRHGVRWDGHDADGRRMSSGIYFYVLQAGEFRASRKMLLVQ